MMSIWLSSLSPVRLIERSIGHHVPGTLFVNPKLREAYRGAIGAADFDVESPPGFAADGVGVNDGTGIPFLDAELRDGDHVERLVCFARHCQLVPGRG